MPTQEYLSSLIDVSEAEAHAHEVNSELHPAPSEVTVSESTPEPLFNKDTVYHAGVCSLAVNTCDAGNYQQFFKKKEMVRGHSFKEVSLSHPKQDRYIIAKQSDSTVYFGFQSEPQLLEWSKQSKSFGEGITAQSEKFPIQFILELLDKQEKIVLTGFSFGGLLACAVTTRVWNKSYIPTDQLKQNLVCITFGQPHVVIPKLEEVASEQPALMSTIHSFYCKDDPVPRLLKFLDKSWSQEGRAPFQDPITSDVLTKLDKLQNPSVEDQGSLLVAVKSTLKRIVSGMDPNSTAKPPCSACATFHLISTVPGVGLKCTTLNQEQAELQSDYLQQTDIEYLGVDLFKQHSPVQYTQRKLFRGYLEKRPEYKIPNHPMCALKEVADVKLSAKAVKIHHRGDEIAVVVEGESFWFCYCVTVGGHSRLIPAQDINGSFIQFSISVQDEVNVTVKEGKITISLHSYFSRNPIEHDVEVDEKRYDISTCQQQLARLTPSKVIELAFLCALLEQHPYSSFEPLSHKLDVIRSFLEMVVHIVPLESIVFAIAHGNETVQEMCSEALVASRDWLVIPPSQLLADVARSAIARYQYDLRVTPFLIEKIERREVSDQLPALGHGHNEDHSYVDVTSHEPGAETPTSPPLYAKPSEINMTRDYLFELHQKSVSGSDAESCILPKICGLNIDKMYPISHGSVQRKQQHKLKSPLDVLVSGRQEISDLREAASASQITNQQMLKVVSGIRKREVATCTTLLGAFMEQEETEIEFRTDSSAILAAASVGVCDDSEVQPKQFPLKIKDYIRVKFSNKSIPEICEENKIDTTTTVDTLLMKWDQLFEENALSLIGRGYRPLIARWLIWALMIHNLRKELAEYTAVGVVGLVNSGKSKLVNTLFGIKIPVGTAEAKHNTVPFLYNLGEHFEGLDVVDFPGVDDEDDTIADLLVTIAQIVIFVVDYRKVHIQSAKKWLERLQTKKVPVLVCFTFGDKFYAEHMTDGQHPEKEIIKQQLKDQLHETAKKLGPFLSCKFQFFSFSQDRDSVLNSDEGRQKLKDVGIGSPQDVGEWLVEVFQDFGQETLALKLESFIHNPPQD